MNNYTVIKAPLIETKTWKKVKEVIIINRASDKDYKYKEQSDVVNEVLIRHSEKKIAIQKETEKETAKHTKIKLTEETTKLYNELPEGNKSYIINGLLRAWLKENE